MVKCNKLHGEAWQHRLRGELELMKVKQNKAKLVKQKAKSYAYVAQHIWKE
jgi:hypothetical protein